MLSPLLATTKINDIICSRYEIFVVLRAFQSYIMKKLFALLYFILPSVAYGQITIHANVKGFGDKICIGYWKDLTYVNDTLQLSGDKATFSFKSTSPVYFKLATITPASYTPFLMAFPGETIDIEKNVDHVTLKGGAARFNNFLIKTDSAMRVTFTGKRIDYNTVPKYLLDCANEFFSTFSHPDKQLIKDVYSYSIIADKLYTLMTKYSNDTSKINSLYFMIKNHSAIGVNNDDVLKYIDRVDFNNPNIGFANVPGIATMNNFVRMLREKAVAKDSLLKGVDEYMIETKIIKDLFKTSRYRSRLLAYNLHTRIADYTEYPTMLAEVDNYIADLRKENFSSDLLPPIEKLYADRLNTIGSLAKGAIAPAFALPDRNGKRVSLADFKGKVVYLDMWASWCGPCAHEMPYMEALKKKYSNKAVEMIAISIDTDIQKWLQKTEALKLSGTQLIDSKGSENSKIAKDYKIYGVPHYVLIDKNGRIVSVFAPSPSSGVIIEKEINRLL